MAVLIVNAERVDTTLPPATPLLDFLRDTLRLTAAKPGCSTGDCGACLVLLGEHDGALVRYRTVNACLCTLAQADGCQVVTAEGLAGDVPTPVQQALLEAGAIQCGYCTPGLVVALSGALLNGESLPAAVAGNLCRCTGYAGIRRACAMLAHAGIGADGALPPAISRAAQALRSRAALPLSAVHGRPLAGATDWLPQHRHRQDTPGAPVLLRRVPAARVITADDAGWRIGAAITIAELQQHAGLAADWPSLPGFLDCFASPSVRNSATVGGNLANASPVADLAVLLLALDASVLLHGEQGERSVALADFFLSWHRTMLADDEWLVAVRVPRPRNGQTLHFAKVAKRPTDDIATVNIALRITLAASDRISDLRIAAGGVAPVPLLLGRAAACLLGTVPDVATLCAAMTAAAAECSAQDDFRGSAAYKRDLLGHLLLGLLAERCPALPVAACLADGEARDA